MSGLTLGKNSFHRRDFLTTKEITLAYWRGQDEL